MNENDIAREIVDAAYHIHQTLGPGLRETVDEIVLMNEVAGPRSVVAASVERTDATERVPPVFKPALGGLAAWREVLV